MFHGDAQAFLGQVRSFEDLISRLLKLVLFVLTERAAQYVVLHHVLFARSQHLFANVLYKGTHERSSNLFDTLFQPHIIVEEVSFSSQNTKIDHKFVILAIDDLD